MLQDKSGDIFPLSLKDLSWNGTDRDSVRDEKYRSSELYIGINKEVEI
jgi:hypothetical protein